MAQKNCLTLKQGTNDNYFLEKHLIIIYDLFYNCFHFVYFYNQ